MLILQLPTGDSLRPNHRHSQDDRTYIICKICVDADNLTKCALVNVMKGHFPEVNESITTQTFPKELLENKCIADTILIDL